MKIKILSLALTVFTLVSCEDVLDIAPEGRKSLDEIFQSEVTTGAYLNGCYQNFPQFGFGDFFWTSNPVGLSDNAWEYHTDPGILLVQAYNGNITPVGKSNKLVMNVGPSGNFPNISSWDLFYRNINRCNVFLKYIKTAAVPSEQHRERWTAEARVLRAFYYLELMGRFGNVALLTEPSEMDYNFELLKREKCTDIADYVIAECKDVIEHSTNLPWRITVASEAERMTKGIAAAIISRISLYVASPLFCEGTNRWNETLQDTKYALDKLIANGYALYESVQNPSIFDDNAYFEYNCINPDISDNPVDKESILCSRQNIQNWFDVMGTPITGSNKAGLCPTQEFVDAFPMKDGKYILDLKEPYSDADHLHPNYVSGSGYDVNRPYENRDPRFYALILYNGCKILNNENNWVDLQAYNGGNSAILVGNNTRTCTGYYPRKHYHPYQKRTAPNYPNRPKIFRLSEMYMNYAEAAAENGQTDKVLEAVKPIRDRVHMPNLDLTGKSKEEIILMVRNERRIELGYEGIRYYDIRRWAQPGGEFTDGSKIQNLGSVQTGIWIEKNGPDQFEYHRIRVGNTYDKNTNTFGGDAWFRHCFTSKYLMHPVMQDEADRLFTKTGVVWQNPGW